MMGKFHRRAAMVSGVALVWLSACVHPQQIELIEREQRRLRSDMGMLQGDVDSLRTSLADTRANMQQVQREVSAIRERIDETRVQVGRQIGQSSREGDERTKRMETRLTKLEEELKAQAELLKTRDEEIKQLRETAGGAANLAGGYAEFASAESDAVRRDYEIAWRALERREYRQSLELFKEFQRKHPKSALAANAQYWIGENHYALREYDRAIVEFDAVRRRYSRSGKVPAALLKQGFAFAELGEKINARLILLELIEKFPQSPEAAQAKQKLKAIES